MKTRFYRAAGAFGHAKFTTSRGRARSISNVYPLATPSLCRRGFHNSRPWQVIRPYILADIGEGITECQIISWSVKSGDRVQQFDPICEVQSDKATVDITSRFDGVVKTLHYEQDDVAVVGQPLLDMDVLEDDTGEGSTTPVGAEPGTPEGIFEGVLEQPQSQAQKPPAEIATNAALSTTKDADVKVHRPNSALLTPALRHMLKKFDIDHRDVEGTGRDERITKEDVQRFLTARSNAPATISSLANAARGSSSMPSTTTIAEDDIVRMNAVEKKMFEVMTQSLTIPHFLYTQNVDITSLSSLRQSFNRGKPVHFGFSTDSTAGSTKLSFLPFIIKAVSQAFLQHPKMNAHLATTTTTTNASDPELTLKASHNFSIAVDTPQGLVVPVIKNVQSHSIVSLSQEIKRLGDLAQAGRLSPLDFQGGTFTVSNIGSIGGNTVSPIIVAPMVAILGVGRAQDVPVFTKDAYGVEVVVKQEQVVLSWSADHRVLDGATVAKAAEYVKELLANVNQWGLYLK